MALRLAPFGLVILLATSLASAALPEQERDAGRADYTHRLGVAAEGDVSGTCETRAAALPNGGARAAVFHARHATLRLFDNWWNSSVLLPEAGGALEYPINGTQKARVVELAPGPVRIQWEATGQATILEWGAFAPRSGGLRTEFSADALRTRAAHSGDPVARFWTPNEPEATTVAGVNEELKEYVGGFPGPARVTELEATRVRTMGNMSVFLQDATVEAGDAVIQLLPLHTVSSTPSPAWTIRTDRLQQGLLDLEDAWIDHEETPTLHCHALSGHVRGTLLLYDASGTVTVGPDAVSFQERVLTLRGDVDFEESPAPEGGSDAATRDVDGSAQGRFDAVELDFGSQAMGAASGTAATPIILGAAATAGLGFALWKLASFLFTRLHRDALLELPERRRIYEAIEAAPGVTLAQLHELEGTNPSTARYHLSVLQRHQRIRAFKVNGLRRFVAADADLDEVRTRTLVAEDPALRALLAQVGPTPTPAARVVDELQRGLGLSRSGAWKVIDRACAARLVLKEPLTKGVLLRTAS